MSLKTKIIFLAVILAAMILSLSCKGDITDGAESPDDHSIVDEKDPDPAPQSKPRSGFPPDVQRWPLTGTGQYQCFDHEKKIPCPSPGDPFYGQDGNYQIGVRAFGVNANATVTDSLTGHVWQQSFVAKVSWHEARSYCENLTLAGHSWRLPTTHELKTLVNYGRSNPAIDTAAFPDTPDGELSDWFWASPVRHDALGEKDAAWIISFIDGMVEYTARDNKYHVRCLKAN